MPFGKAKSCKELCREITAWCKAFSKRFHESYKIPIILESYVDDFLVVQKNRGEVERETNEMLKYCLNS